MGFLLGYILLTGKNRFKPLLSLSLLLVISFGLLGTVRSVASASASVSWWIRSPRNISDRATRSVFGDDMKFINIVRRTTPESSRIIIPPVYPGRRHTADIWLMSSLLYPRQIVTYVPGLELSSFDYLLISSESDNPGAGISTWPDFDVPKAKVMIYGWDSDSWVETGNAGYLWQTESSGHPWGLLDLKTNQ